MTAAYGLLLRTLATRGRVAAVGAAGLLLVAVAAVGVAAGERNAFAIDLVAAGGLAVLAPVAALVFGTAVLGDLREDGTLPYLWLTPVARSRLALSAAGAALTVALPAAVLPLATVALLAGSPALVGAAAAAAALATAAYGCLFVAFGLRSRRALLYGLVYVLLWENVVSRLSEPLARSSVRVHAASLLAAWSEARLPRFAVDPAVASAVLVVAAAAGLALAATLLRDVELE